MSEKAKPAAANGGRREMIVSDWNAHQKNTLRGFLSFTTASRHGRPRLHPAPKE